VNLHLIDPFAAIAVTVFIEATYTVPSAPIEGPPPPPTDGTTQRSAPSALSEYTLPNELAATTTPPSGPTAGGWSRYCPGTWKRHFTTPGDAELAPLAAVTASNANAQATTTARRLIPDLLVRRERYESVPGASWPGLSIHFERRTWSNPRAGAAPRRDQPLAAEKVERAYDRRPADVILLGEGAFGRQTRARSEAPADDRGAELVGNVGVARSRLRSLAAPHSR
jgi:hypothetical protein